MGGREAEIGPYRSRRDKGLKSDKSVVVSSNCRQWSNVVDVNHHECTETFKAFSYIDGRLADKDPSPSSKGEHFKASL